MNTSLFKPAKILTFLMGVSNVLADTETPAYGETCGEEIDWYVELEGSGIASDNNWTYKTATSVTSNSKTTSYEKFGSSQNYNPFRINKQPWQLNLEQNNFPEPYVEPGDMLFKKLDNAFWDDFHTGIFAEAIYNEIYPFKFQLDGVSYHSVFSCFNCDATKEKHHFINEVEIDLMGTSNNVVNQFKLAQSVWSTRWGTNSGDYWRGSRIPSPNTPGGISLSRTNRQNILGTALSMVNHDIDYIFESSIDQKNSPWTWGWEGTVTDIDQIRCDGFGEFAYENNNIRVWGDDSYWNLGSGSDAAYDKHKDSWEGFDYSLNELSPMVQSGCGGYGKGERTTLRGHPIRHDPYIRLEQFVMSNGTIELNINDLESTELYYTLQVQVNKTTDSEWKSIIDFNRVPTDANGNFGIFYQWNGAWRNRSGQGVLPVNSPDNKYNFRIIVVDQGGNVSLKEFSTNGIQLSNTGDSRRFYFESSKTGRIQYRLKMSPGPDFDLYIHDLETNDLLGSGILGGSQNEYVEFFIRENQRYYIDVVSYSGSGQFFIQEYKFLPAKEYLTDKIKVTNQTNNWEMNFSNLPYAPYGWAITWSREWEGRDLDMTLTYPGGGTYSSRGTSDTEYDFINGSLGTPTNIRVFDYNQGQLFGGDYARSKNVFRLWYMDGEGLELINDY